MNLSIGLRNISDAGNMTYQNWSNITKYLEIVLKNALFLISLFLVPY